MKAVINEPAFHFDSGHSFITVDKEGHTEWSRGFYPNENGDWFGGVGLFVNDSSRQYTDMREFTASPKTVKLIEEKAAEDLARHLVYSVFAVSLDPNARDANCTSWAIRTLIYAGYKDWNFDIAPEPSDLANSPGFEKASPILGL